jgi:D-alanine-D-alanine ligase
MRKIRLGLLFGGRSPEHEISITTAASIAKEADPERIEIVPVYISREGRWLQLAGSKPLAELAGRLVDERQIGPIQRREVLLSGAAGGGLVAIRGSEDGAGAGVTIGRDALTAANAQEPNPAPIDVLFPALHGQGGEDGSVQGLARLAGIPCVGAGILGSALGMDKVSMKRIASSIGIPIPQYVAFTREDWQRNPSWIRAEIEEHLNLPVFVKPSGAGSSVGITKVHDLAKLDAAVRDAARYDYRILVEEGIDARELEVALLGNADPQASVVGEIVPGGEFYDYHAKYIDDTSQAVIPAEIPKETAETVRVMAARIFRALDLAGMARADFLLDRRTGIVYFNEVNTIPGFTPISMYPMLWEASGIGYRDLITRLVELAIEQHRSTQVETIAPKVDREDPSGGDRS